MIYKELFNKISNSKYLRVAYPETTTHLDLITFKPVRNVTPTTFEFWDECSGQWLQADLCDTLLYHFAKLSELDRVREDLISIKTLGGVKCIQQQIEKFEDYHGLRTENIVQGSTAKIKVYKEMIRLKNLCGF